MKKIVLTSISLLLACFSWSQSFAPEGALWHYSYHDINPNVVSYATIESESDTVIDGTSCMKMLEVRRYINDTIDTQWHYMYSENDSVFFYAEGGFHLLYDFSAEESDTITLEYFETYDGSPLEMVVDSVNYVDFSGVTKKVQHVTCIETIAIDFGPMIIEGIGRTRYMFPSYDGQNGMKWRCYEDNQNGLLLNPFDIGDWDGQNCEQIITAIEEIKPVANATISPNPVNNFLDVKSEDIISEYFVTDEGGRLLISGSPNKKDFQIDFQPFNSGIYFLKLSAKETNVIKKVVKL